MKAKIVIIMLSGVAGYLIATDSTPLGNATGGECKAPCAGDGSSGCYNCLPNGKGDLWVADSDGGYNVEGEICAEKMIYPGWFNPSGEIACQKTIIGPNGIIQTFACDEQAPESTEQDCPAYLTTSGGGEPEEE